MRENRKVSNSQLAQQDYENRMAKQKMKNENDMAAFYMNQGQRNQQSGGGMTSDSFKTFSS
jgi:hypothetical protein